jgi:hypothetical protein
MGNQGITDPPTMRRQAAAIAEDGIRTITVGIGAEYEAAQLTALADGGGGEFHHATNPGEIVEIVLGELRAMRVIAARDLELRLTVRGARRWILLGGDSRQQGERGRARFDRVSTGRSVRAVALVWPEVDGVLPVISAKATWLDAEKVRHETRLELDPSLAPARRDRDLAARVAALWHAQIVARALELNERGEHRRAERFVRRVMSGFAAYVVGLRGVSDLVDSLRELAARVGSEFRTTAHRESYAMARKVMMAREDLREAAPVSYMAALSLDESLTRGRRRPSR